MTSWHFFNVSRSALICMSIGRYSEHILQKQNHFGTRLSVDQAQNIIAVYFNCEVKMVLTKPLWLSGKASHLYIHEKCEGK
jgi:hypothetical protein